MTTGKDQLYVARWGVKVKDGGFIRYEEIISDRVAAKNASHAEKLFKDLFKTLPHKCKLELIDLCLSLNGKEVPHTDDIGKQLFIPRAQIIHINESNTRELGMSARDIQQNLLTKMFNNQEFVLLSHLSHSSIRNSCFTIADKRPPFDHNVMMATATGHRFTKLPFNIMNLRWESTPISKILRLLQGYED
jgi:hypothetical protein